MKIYFLSARPCALTLNKVYFGITDKFERFAEVTLSDRVFAEFSAEGCLPLGFFITEELPFSPPAGCEVYLLKNGIAIYAQEFTPTDFTLRPIAQQRFEENLVTLFYQGNLHLSLETSEGLFISTLPPSFMNARFSFRNGLFLIEGQNMLAVYTKKGELVLLEEFLSFSVDGNELIATLPLSDRLSRVAKCRWEMSENGCTRTEFVLSQPTKNKENATGVLEELLPFAFFESVLIGAEYAEFLSEELLPDKEKLLSFLGNFQSVTLTQDPNTCGLVKQKAERLFEVDYYTVEVENGKIIDIRK